MNFDQFKTKLGEVDSSKVAIVGLGNEHRGDDSAGIIFLNLLKSNPLLNKATFINAGTNPENYLELILTCKPELVIFIDASRFGGQPGEIKFLDPDELNSISISTHSFSIKMIEEYLYISRKMKFLYIGIQPLSTDFGAELSEEVSAGIKNFVGDF